MYVTKDKNCFCHTCNRWFHYLGIARHTAMHRDRKQDCEVTYTHGDRYKFNNSENPNGSQSQN